MVTVECGDVRVRSPSQRVRRLDGPFEYAFQAQDLQHRLELRDQTLVALHPVYLFCEGRGEPDSELPEAVHLGAQERDDRAEERDEAGLQGHRSRTERTQTSRGHDRG